MLFTAHVGVVACGPTVLTGRSGQSVLFTAHVGVVASGPTV